MKTQTIIRRCRDCSSAELAPKEQLCARCKTAAAEKRRLLKREKSLERYRSAPKAEKPPRPPKPPHPCATGGCGSSLTGRAQYCPACSYSRKLQRQKFYRANLEPVDDDLPPAPPTSLAWLDKFQGWAGSGLSYADYQKTEWEMKNKPRQRAASKRRPR